jgi:hypothetical protein
LKHVDVEAFKQHAPTGAAVGAGVGAEGVGAGVVGAGVGAVVGAGVGSTEHVPFAEHVASGGTKMPPSSAVQSVGEPTSIVDVHEDAEKAQQPLSTTAPVHTPESPHAALALNDVDAKTFVAARNVH